jgi:phosphoglycolate phosphatase
MPIHLVVFDLDGTLIDSRRDLADSVNALIAEYGAEPLAVDAVTAMVGEGAAVLVGRALAAAGLDPEAPGALDRFLAHYDRRLTAHTVPYPGMAETLAALEAAGYRLAVLTNKPQRPSAEILERLGLTPFFSDVVGGDTAFGRKPDPAGLLALAARAGVPATRTMMVGDSTIDVQTARLAGAVVCIARYGFGIQAGEVAAGPGEITIDAPPDLVAVLESFRSDNGGVPLPETSRSRT